MIRRAQASTPPKPDSEIAVKAKNSSAMVAGGGAVAAGAFGAFTGGAGGPAGGLIEVV